MTATTTTLYATGAQAFLSGAVATSHTIKMAFVTGSYTPQVATDTVWSNISAYEASGTGYTAGGQALTSIGTGVLNSTGVAAREANTAYSLDQTIAVGSYIYVCIVSGTTAITAPTFPTIKGQTVTDGTVMWMCMGIWVAYFTSATPTWNPLTVNNVRYAVIYDVTAGGQLLVLIDFGSSNTYVGPFAVQPDPNVGWYFISG